MIDLNYLKLRWELFKLKFFGEENGAVDLIVIVILIAVAIILAVVFRRQLLGLIKKLFKIYDEQTDVLTEIPE